MNPLASLRDVYLIARFDVLRALRTWWAAALFVLYGLATAGAAYGFIQLIGAMEDGLATQMGVAKTEVPGAMLQELMQRETFQEVLRSMVGSEAALQQILEVPVLAIFNLWFGFMVMPFFAAMASSEAISVDLGSRAIRYEALRTGRIELVAGRYVGQLVLTGIATAISVAGVFVLGLTAMRGNEPAALLWWLCWLSLRAWFFSMPFVGIGVAASQLTGWPMVARVMALIVTAGTWMLYGMSGLFARYGMPVVGDLLVQVLPQGWMQAMWEPVGWLVPALVCATLGPVFSLVGYVRFSRMDL